jgi:hypothetical protein
VKKKTRLARLNSNTQAMVKLAKILRIELLLQRGDNALKQPWTGGVKPCIFGKENPNPCNFAIVPGLVAITYITHHRR